LQQIAGVSRVLSKESRETRAVFEIESLKNKSVRGDVARAVVEGGWDLNELRSAAASLEEIFLQLTQEQKEIQEEPAEVPA
jgi:ABC-2 type transport system ATP-binding protein